MGSYRETNDEPDIFYIDTFGAGQHIEITQVIRDIGGEVEYDREAHHLGEARARYRVTLPVGCEFVGLDEPSSPQTITLPGDPTRRKLCVYPQRNSIILAWLPGDSTQNELWNGSVRTPQTDILEHE